MPDWKKIKAEYINGNISYRDLADKYGVSFSTISKKAIRENWTDLKEQVGNEIETKMRESVVENAVTSATNFNETVDRLLQKVNEHMDEWVTDPTSLLQFANTLTRIQGLKHLDSKDVEIDEEMGIVLLPSVDKDE